jgi:putative flavoprotein involved in K+ transport
VRTEVLIIGAGHSGLAMSRRLTEHGVEHVVLDRGEPGNAWRTERWESLRLLTPNWQTGLPGHDYAGDDPDGFMGSREVADHLAAYARAIGAPVRAGVTVTSVAPLERGYRVTTDHGVWEADAVVLANGGSGIPNVPAHAEGVPSGVLSLSAKHYRSPEQLPEGGVLVVGASASGVQLADEIARSGREVTISTGEHVRMPRSYRGRDIFWWMHEAGVLDYKGRLWHEGGVIPDAPGLYVLGTSLLRRRRSTYISGAASDTAELAEHLVEYLGGRESARAELAS